MSKIYELNLLLGLVSATTVVAVSVSGAVFVAFSVVAVSTLRFDPAVPSAPPSVDASAAPVALAAASPPLASAPDTDASAVATATLLVSTPPSDSATTAVASAAATLAPLSPLVMASLVTMADAMVPDASPTDALPVPSAMAKGAAITADTVEAFAPPLWYPPK